MKADKRRQTIADYLLANEKAITGAALAREFGVSRQIIVQDISTLKAAGYDIIPTHYGYVLRKAPQAERVIKTFHTTDQTKEELSLIVSLGGSIVNVFVWHKVYGKVSAPLNIFSRLQVKQFIEGVRTGKSSELMNITGGYHYHTVRAESEEILQKIEDALTTHGFIAPGV